MKFQGDVEFVQTPRAVEAAALAAGETVALAKERRRRAIAGGETDNRPGNHSVHPIVEELFDLPAAKHVLEAIGIEHLRSDNESIILLSKYPGAPPLYWHQDLMSWDHAIATTPWPTRIFLNYYTVDTTKENGCACAGFSPRQQFGRTTGLNFLRWRQAYE